MEEETEREHICITQAYLQRCFFAQVELEIPDIAEGSLALGSPTSTGSRGAPSAHSSFDLESLLRILSTVSHRLCYKIFLGAARRDVSKDFVPNLGFRRIYSIFQNVE